MLTETTMNNIISDIITARQSKVEALRVKRNELAAIRENLEKLLRMGENVRQDASFQKVWKYNPWLQALLEKPKDVQECAAQYAAAIGELDRLIGRYGRESVNIAVVGDSKAGKSLLLQTISGLGNECIPSFKGSFCTGVSSVIENNCELDPGQARAVITFKTEEEILEEINGRLDKITNGSLRFGTLAELGRQPAEQLKSKMMNTALEGEKGHISDFLEMYVEHFAQWQKHIRPTGSEPEALVETFTDPKVIQTYVAKHDGGDQENGGVGFTSFYQYIAVKKAVIYCRFRLTDVNQLRLVDTVGLGDPVDGNTVGKMYAAIDTESDAALYLFRPIANKGGMIDDWTYDILNHELYPRYKNAEMEKWMGVVINYDGTNLNECKAFLTKLQENAPEMAQNVAFTEIIDVSKEEDVRLYSLIPILESLSQNLSSIDARIEQGAKSLIHRANKSLTALKEGCREVRIPTQEDLIFDNRKKAFSDFVGKVRTLTDSGRSLKDEFLQKSLEQVEALKEKRTAEICGMFDYAPAPSSRQYLAFGELQRTVRQIGSRSDQDLDKAERELKTQLAKYFLESFGFEENKCPGAESETFFQEMAERLFGSNTELQMLKDAFLSVHTFKLNETKGMTKILFNEKVDEYLNCETMSQKDAAASEKAKTSYEKADMGQIPPHPLRYGVPQKGAAPAMPHYAAGAQTPGNGSGGNQTGGEKHTDSGEKDILTRKMNRQLDQFVAGIKNSEFYRIANSTSISRQIDSELRYFLHFFDVCYQVEWTIVLNQQLRDGNIFASKKQDMDKLSEKFEQLRRLANQSLVNVCIPQNISANPV